MNDDARAGGEKDQQFRDEALRWLPEVTRFALSLTRDESEADDLVQETYLRAYRSWHQYQAGTACRGWLFTICRNTLIRQVERARRELVCDDPELEALAGAAVHASAAQEGLDDIFSRVDVGPAIARAVADLPEVYRTAVALVDVQDESYDTAATILGVPIGTLRSRLFRGRRLLQESLVTYARDVGLRAHESGVSGGSGAVAGSAGSAPGGGGRSDRAGGTTLDGEVDARKTV